MTQRIAVTRRTPVVRLSKRKGLMLSCAAAAIAAGVIAPQRAHAQAFQGNVTGSTNASRGNFGTGTETITVTSQTATIDWTATSDDFLPSTNTATFTSSSGVTDYTVLNRIVPNSSNPLQLNGDILSTLEGGSTTGGRIWFYAPSGIVVGSTANFDVGSLLLSTANISSFSADGSNFSLSTNPAASGSTIEIQAGAQIRALNNNSYIALLAPRIVQRGTVTADGSIAYVAAEQATMSINQGLFDITVNVGGGADGGIGIDHSGTTRGISPTDPDTRGIFMVAVSKNTAIEMLLGGDIGYTTAGGAFVDNGQIVLAAGRNVQHDGAQMFLNEANSNAANIQIGAGTYRSHVTAYANTNMNAQANAGDITFQNGIFFRSAYGNAILGASNTNGLFVDGLAEIWTNAVGDNAAGNITIGASSGGNVTFTDALNLQATAFGSPNGLPVTGGTIAVIANGGDITVNGALNAYTQANGGNPNYTFGPVDAQGGGILFRAENNGSLTTGNLTADSSAWGQRTDLQGYSAGDGTAGNIGFQADSGGLLQINGALVAHADGYGGEVSSHGDGAGVGTGATAYGTANGGTIQITGGVNLTANGQGGSVVNPVTAIGISGGAGHGGGWGTTIAGVGFSTQSDTSSITIGGFTSLSANGIGGHGFTGGEGIGGDAGLRSNAGLISVAGDLNFNSRGTGGNASFGFGGVGGFAQGGTNYIQAELSAVGATSSSISGGNVSMDVGATGGTGGAGNGSNIAAGAGGNAVGGTHTGTEGTGGAHVIAENTGGQLSLANLTLLAGAQGGAGGIGGAGQSGGAGGTGTGGTISAGTFRRPPFTNTEFDAQVVFGSVNLNASATGGDGGAGGAGGVQGNGGAAFGGGHCGVVDTCGGIAFGVRGAVTMTSAILVAQAAGGAGTVGGNATGGDIGLIGRPGGSLTAGGVDMNSSAFGGAGLATGGNATGGATYLDFDGASISATGLGIRSNATGGTGGVLAGNAQGGRSTVRFGANGGSMNITGAVQVLANGFGGDGLGSGAAAGSATGGTSIFEILSPSPITLTTGNLDVRAVGNAGEGGSGAIGGTGGNAQGGTTTVALGNANLTAGFVTQLSTANAGQGGAGTDGPGGDGGNAVGGTSTFSMANSLTASAVTIGASGNAAGSLGGTSSGSTGGNGQGGTATATINGAVTTTSPDANQGFLVTAYGGGGGQEGDPPNFIFDAVDNGGSGQGGTSSLTIGGTGSLSTNYIQVTAQAGDGRGRNGSGGSATGGNATLQIDGTATNTGRTFVSTNATGGSATLGAGGNATGGDSQINVTGSLTSSVIELVANATGGTTLAGNGGDAAGGTATLSISDGSVTAGSLDVVANATGGEGFVGGDATTDEARVQIDALGGSLNVSGLSIILAETVGGDGIVNASGTGGAGGNATSGTAAFVTPSELAIGAVVSVALGDLDISAFAEGGWGNTGINGGAGGNATGGESEFTLASGTMTAGRIRLFSTGVAGNGGDATGPTGTSGNGGNGQGGNALANISGTLTAGQMSLQSNAEGGDSVDAPTIGIGGSGTGGTSTATIDGSATFTSPVDVQGLVVTSFAGGGDGSSGGIAQGGTSTLTVNGSLNTTQLTQVTARALGGLGLAGAGGEGHGGDATLIVNGLHQAGRVVVETTGTGGNGTTIGGLGIGGSSALRALSGGDGTYGGLSVRANGEAGESYGGNGSDGTGGSVELLANGTGSTLTITGVTPVTDVNPNGETMAAIGYGGYTSAAGATAGTGRGGTLGLYAQNGGSVTFQSAPAQGLLLHARGYGGWAGGEGSRGGDGYGGDLTIGLNAGTLNTALINPSAYGEGGKAFITTLNITGGDGYGGTRIVNVTNGSSLTTAFNGGTAGAGGGNGSGTGNGGNATGGTATMLIDNSTATFTADSSVITQEQGGSGAVGGNATGGTATVSIINGAIVNAVGLGVGTQATGGNGRTAAGSAQGGTSQLFIGNGGAAVTANVGLADVYSYAFGGDIMEGFTGVAGNGTGGTSTVTVSGGDTLSFSALSVDARAWGGWASTEFQTGSGDGGDAFGGWASLLAEDGSITSGTTLTIQSSALGGNGTITGGNASHTAETPVGLEVDATARFNISGATQILADSTGGNGGTGAGGDAFGGVASLTWLATSNLNGLGSVTVSATGTGGNSASGAGGTGTGGLASADLAGSYSGSGMLSILASALGGTGASGGRGEGGFASLDSDGFATTAGFNVVSSGSGGDGTAGAGGFGEGGSSMLDVEAGAIVINGITSVAALRADGTGGAGTAGGGGALGGISDMTATGPGQIALASVPSVTASAFGGNGGSGAGGNANAGTAGINAFNGGQISGFNLQIAASAVGGNGATGGTASANRASIVASGAGSQVTFINATLAADANGGAGTTGNGGLATGGIGLANAEFGGTANFTGSPIFSVRAIGGNSTAGGNGGMATGGDLDVRAEAGSTLNTGALSALATATGGNGTTGGTAQGGTVELLSEGGTLATSAQALLDASARGGSGNSAGNATAGRSGVYATLGGDLLLARVSVRAEGTGGTSSAAVGGTGTGGVAEMVASGAGSEIRVLNFTSAISGYINPTAMISSNGAGGASTGSNGGNGTGGDSNLLASAGANIVLATPTLATQRHDIVARGFGGAASAAGTTAGTARGGDITIGADNATMTIPNMLASSFAQAGNYGNPITDVNGGEAIGGTRVIYARNGATMSIAMTGGGAGAGGGYASGSGNGGNATGGTVSLEVDASTMNLLGNVGVIAGGEGGAGAQGGNASGGTATVNVVNGGVIQSALPGASLAVGAPSTGGAGTANGGSATAANVTVNVDATSRITLAGSMSTTATAVGGNAGSGNGGNATGSTTAMNIQGLVNVASLSIDGNVTGGSSTGGSGGLADAALARVAVDGGSLTVTGATTVTANARGGDGAVDGGDGTAGTATLEALNGAIVELGTATSVLAMGTGGTAGSNLGGDGVGGDATLAAYDGSSILANALTVDASGVGGNGRSGGFANGGSDGEGGGGALVDANGFDAVVTLTGNTIVRADAIAGNAQPTGAGGAAFGGSARMRVLDGEMTFDTASVSAEAQSGTGGTGGFFGTGGEVGFTTIGGSLTGNSAQLSANGSEQGGTVRISAFSGEFDGFMDVATLTATANGGLFAGDILFDIGLGSIGQFGAVTLMSNGSVPANDEDGIELGSEGVFTANSLAMASSDGIRISTANGGTIDVAGTIDANSLSLIRLLDDGAGGPITSSTLDLAGDDIDFSAAVQADDILLTLPGDYAINALPVAANSLTVNAGGTISAAETVSYGSSLALQAGMDLLITDLDAVGAISLNATNNLSAGDLTAGGNISLTTTAGSVTTGALDATGGIIIDAGSDVTVGNTTAAALGVEIHSGGDLDIDDVTANTGVELDAIGDVTSGAIDSATHVIVAAGGGFDVGDVDAGTTADFTAGGLANFRGTVSAPLITVTSAQINMAPEGGLGEQGLTTLITLNAVSDNLAILIGGEEPGAQGQWHLTDDGDISADAVVINAVASATGGSAPDIRVRAVEIDGSQSDGGGVQTVTLNTASSVLVEGPVAFLNAAATDTLAINAGESIQVDTASGGGIAMTNGDDVSGILELTAHDIWVAEGDLLAELANSSDLGAFGDDLSVNNGAVNPAGAIQAGDLTVTMLGSSFLVQNTGTADQPAGLTVGDGGLTVVNEGTDAATVIIYGRQTSSDGTVTSGDDFAEGVTFEGNDTFSDGSSVNGCEAGGSCTPEQPPVEGGGVEVILGPIGLMEGPSALVSTETEFGDPAGEEYAEESGEDEATEEEEEEEESEEEGKSGVNTGTGLINAGPVTLDVPIEEPVTSGNDGPGGL